MARKIFGMDKVLDPWLKAEHDDEVREAVLRKVMWVGDNLEEISTWPANPGEHPLRRTIELDEGVVITFFLTRPILGAELLAIDYLEGFEPF